MNTNSNQSTDKNHSGAVFRIIGVLFVLLAFFWLPAAVRGQPDAFEPDNTPEQASFIYDPGERNFHEAQDEDWMLFYGPKKEPDYSYEIFVTALGNNTNLDPMWTIYDSDGKTVLLTSSDGTQFTPPETTIFILLRHTIVIPKFLAMIPPMRFQYFVSLTFIRCFTEWCSMQKPKNRLQVSPSV